VEQSGNVRVITFSAAEARDVEDMLARQLAGRTDGLEEGHLLLDFTQVEKVAKTLGLCRFLALCGAFSTDPRKEVAETLGLPRGRQEQPRRPDAPLLVLVPQGRSPSCGQR
jgi:hypothetical protein